MTDFDKNEFYKKELKPLIEQIKLKCEANAVGFFISVCTENSEEETKYENDGNLPQSIGLELADDQLTRHLLVSRGFHIAPKATFDYIFEEEN